jgi:hypothetical protein
MDCIDGYQVYRDTDCKSEREDLESWRNDYEWHSIVMQ